MKIVFHSLIFLLFCGSFVSGDIFLPSGQQGNPGSGVSPRLPLQLISYKPPIQPGPLTIPGQPRFNNQFEYKGPPGQLEQNGQIGTAVQPGTYGQGGKPGQPGQFGPMTIPGQPRFNNQFEYKGPPGQLEQSGQIGIAVQPGAYGQGGQPGQPGQFGPMTIPGQPRFNNQFGQPGLVQSRFSNQLKPTLHVQPRFNNQIGQPGLNVQPRMSYIAADPYGPMGQPGFDISQTKPLLDSVTSEYQRFQNLQHEIEQKVMEMIQNQTIQVPSNIQQFQSNLMPQLQPQVIFQDSPFPGQPQLSVSPNPGYAWTPVQQNQVQWPNRFHRSSSPALQALQAQGFQILKLGDYQNFKEFPISGSRNTLPGFTARNDEQTSNQQLNGSSVAQNSTLNAMENFSNIQVPAADIRAASSTDDFVVGSPLQLCKKFEENEQHHPPEERERLKAFCSNISQEIQYKNAQLNTSKSISNEIPLTSRSKNSTVTNNLLRQSTNSVGNLTQPGQPLLNNQYLRTGIDGLSKRFGDSYIGLSEELQKNFTNVSPAPARYLYRASVNGNPPQLIPIPPTANSMPAPVSTSNVYNYNSYNPLTAGRALYQPPNLWPRYAAYNNNYQSSLMNSAPGNPITPVSSNLPKIPLYRSPNYYYYQ